MAIAIVHLHLLEEDLRLADLAVGPFGLACLELLLYPHPNAFLVDVSNRSPAITRDYHSVPLLLPRWHSLALLCRFFLKTDFTSPRPCCPFLLSSAVSDPYLQSAVDGVG